MSTAEKLAAMEQLWTALQSEVYTAPALEWHANILAERQAKIDKGETSFSTIDEVRARLENLRK